MICHEFPRERHERTKTKQIAGRTPGGQSMKKIIFPLLLISSISPPVFAQSIDIGNRGNEPPHPVDLILNISIDQMQNRAPAGLTVQISSDYSSVSRNALTDQASMQTDNSGTVTFHTLTGSHHIRISRPGIEESSRTM